jgi:hypothetical protein
MYGLTSDWFVLGILAEERQDQQKAC